MRTKIKSIMVVAILVASLTVAWKRIPAAAALTTRLSLTALLLPDCSAATASVSAKDYVVGVKNGDWVRYAVTATGPGPEAPTPVWVKVEILSVAGKNVTMRLTTHKQNGTDTNQTSTFELAGTSSCGYTFVIPANLTVGDSISLNGDMRNITSEATRTFAGANRTVIGTTFSDHGNTYSYCFDKQTGVTMELVESHYGIGQVSNNWSADTLAEDTNIWRSHSSNSNEALWIAVIVVITVAVALLVFRRQRRPRHSRKALEGIERDKPSITISTRLTIPSIKLCGYQVPALGIQYRPKLYTSCAHFLTNSRAEE